MKGNKLKAGYACFRLLLEKKILKEIKIRSIKLGIDTSEYIEETLKVAWEAEESAMEINKRKQEKNEKRRKKKAIARKRY